MASISKRIVRVTRPIASGFLFRFRRGPMCPVVQRRRAQRFDVLLQCIQRIDNLSSIAGELGRKRGSSAVFVVVVVVGPVQLCLLLLLIVPLSVQQSGVLLDFGHRFGVVLHGREP